MAARKSGSSPKKRVDKGLNETENKLDLDLDRSASFTDVIPSPSVGKSSITASPSADSISSSVLAHLKFDDEFLLESKDLMVRVDNPEKHSSALDSYITFRILTKTTRSDYDCSEYCVRRRYNDFIWMRQKLEEVYPTHLVPPLPEKHSLQRLNRFTAEFLRTRMMALNKFLIRVADHPVLSFDKSFQIFLTSKPFEFSTYKREGVGLMGRVSTSFHNLAATYMMKSRTPEFENINIYVQMFGDKLELMERVAQRINKEQMDYESELRQLYPVFKLWSSSENQLGRGLVAMASAIEKCSDAQKNAVDRFDNELARPLHEYVLYSDSIKSALKRRDALQIEYELTVEELNNRKVEKEQMGTANQHYSFGAFLGKDPKDIQRDKLERLEKSIESLINQAETNNDKVECANANLRSDLERWHTTKREDLKTMFVSMANREMEYYQKCLAAWEEVIPLIRDTDVDFDMAMSGTAKFEN